MTCKRLLERQVGVNKFYLRPVELIVLRCTETVVQLITSGALLRRLNVASSLRDVLLAEIRSNYIYIHYLYVHFQYLKPSN